jgi:hypothetical protein
MRPDTDRPCPAANGNPAHRAADDDHPDRAAHDDAARGVAEAEAEAAVVAVAVEVEVEEVPDAAVAEEVAPGVEEVVAEEEEVVVVVARSRRPPSGAGLAYEPSSRRSGRSR